MESGIYLDATNPSGCWADAEIGLISPGSDVYTGPLELQFKIRYIGDACWADPADKRRHAYIEGGFHTENNNWETIGSWINGDIYNNGWHNFKVAVSEDRIVKYYIDNVLIYSSVNRIASEALQNEKVILSGRSSGSAGKAYHDNIIIHLESSNTAIGDFVWNDSNQNGIQEQYETGIQGAVVILYDNDDSPLKTTTTDSNGMYTFYDLTPGSYIVEFVLPSGYAFSKKNRGEDKARDSDADIVTGRTAYIDINLVENCFDWDAGMYRLDQDPYKNIEFTQIELIPANPQAGVLCAGDRAVVKLTIFNKNLIEIPAQNWIINIEFYDIWGINNDYIETAWKHVYFGESQQLIQERNYDGSDMIFFNSIPDRSEMIVEIPIILNIRNPTDMSMVFADQIWVGGAPASLIPEYEYSIHKSIHISHRGIYLIGDCFMALLQEVLWKMMLDKINNADIATVIDFLKDLGDAGWYLIDTAISEEKVFDEATLFAKLTYHFVDFIKVTSEKIAIPVQIIKSAYNLDLNCGAEYISAFIADFSYVLNTLGIQNSVYYINPNTGLSLDLAKLIINPGDLSETGDAIPLNEEFIHIENGVITNNIPGSEAFFTDDGIVVVIPGNDTLDMTIKAKQSLDALNITRIVPIGDNESLYDFTSEPINGTILTSRYSKDLGLESIKVDYNEDGSIDNVFTSHYIRSSLSIGGIVFNDLNKNSFLDPDELKLSNWTIKLTDPNGNEIITTTDVNGTYIFDNVSPGKNILYQSLNSSWVQTTPSAARHKVEVTNADIINLNYGNCLKPTPVIHDFGVKEFDTVTTGDQMVLAMGGGCSSNMITINS